MAVMEPFATPDLMADRSQGAITATTHPYLERELEAASQDIRDFCRWHIATAEELTYRRRGRDSEQVWLPAMQIASIGAVKVDGRTLDTDAVARVEFDPEAGWTSLCGRVVEVTYTAGFEAVPANVEAVTLELAAAGLGTSLGYERAQAGSVSVTFGRAGGGIDASSPMGRRLVPYQIGRLP